MKFARGQAGFTLVEISIVVVIITLLMATILGGQALLRSGEAQEIIGMAKDLSSAVEAFKQRYRYMPGDFPVDAANPEIPAVSTAC
mgnify:CR=1 FL=1